MLYYHSGDIKYQKRHTRANTGSTQYTLCVGAGWYWEYWAVFVAPHLKLGGDITSGWYFCTVLVVKVQGIAKKSAFFKNSAFFDVLPVLYSITVLEYSVLRNSSSSSSSSSSSLGVSYG